MSKAKNAAKPGKVGAKDNLPWESGLQIEEVDEDLWKAGVVLATSAAVDDEVAVQLLVNGIRSGSRKLVKAITREELLVQIKEGGKIAGKKLQGRESAWVGAYEVAKQYLDSNEDIPLAIWARIIKAKILTIKDEDLARRDAEKKFLENRQKKPGEAAAGRKSSGKKGAKKAAADSGSADSTAPKVESKLVKRGEEQFVDKYIDDEPEDGPQQYIVVTGFRDAYLPAVLLSVGICPWAVVRVSAEDYNVYNGLAPLSGPTPQPPQDAMESLEMQKQITISQLNDYWRDVGLVLSQPGDTSKLHDIPILEFTYKVAHYAPFADVLTSVTSSMEEKLAATVAFCDDFSTMMYDLVDWRRQYQTWLSHSRIILVPQLTPAPCLDDFGFSTAALQASPGIEPVPAETPPTIDMRYYNTVLDSVPDELCTVPLILHCMLDQVSATAEGRSPPDPNPARPDGLPQSVVNIFNSMIAKSPLSAADVQMLKTELQFNSANDTEPNLVDKMKGPELYAFGDDRALRQRSVTPAPSPQSACKMTPQPVRSLVNIADAERTILKYSPLALAIAALPEPSNCSTRRRVALQNMIANLAQTTGLTPLELSYAFKLLMFESLTLPGVDDDGFVSLQTAENVVPWDDPYPFFRGMITEDELEQIKDEWKHKMVEQIGKDREEEEARLAMLAQQTPEPETQTPSPEAKSGRRSRKSTPGSANKEKSAGRRSPQSKSPETPTSSKRRGSSKARSRSTTPPSEQDKEPQSAGSKRGIMLRSGSGMRRSTFVHFERDQSGRPVRSRQRFDDMEVRVVDRPIDESIADIRRALRRKLTEYCFVEFFAPDALTQALVDCYYERPLLSAYRCRQDNSLLLAFSNPRSHKMFYCEDWASRVFTNVGFRKYLLYVAPTIGDWLVHQESAYMAKLLADDLDNETNEKATSAAHEGKAGKKGRSGSPSKKGKKGTAEDKSAEEKVYAPFITNDYQHPGSLKANKIEEEEARKAEETKAAGKGRKSGSKSPKRAVAGISPEPSARPPSERVPSRRADSAHATDRDRDPHPFTCYDLANQMLVASGLTATLLPSDGGIIRAERFRFETGRESIRVSCLVDSNVFSVHLISPVVDDDTPPIADDSFSPTKPHSHFGSITANLANGVVLSVSSFGPDGVANEGAPYAPKSCLPGSLGPPEGHLTPTTTAAPSAVSKKARGKSPRSRSPSSKKMAEQQPQQIPAPAPTEQTPSVQPGTDDSPSVDSAQNQQAQQPTYTKAPLNVTFPNALSVKFFYFVDPAGRSMLTVRQSYEQRRHLLAQQGSTEMSRLVTPDGSTIRLLQNGETHILYPDGAVYKSQPIDQQPTKEEIAAAEAAAAAAAEAAEKSRGKGATKQAPMSRAKLSVSIAAKEDGDKTEEIKKPPEMITYITADGYLSRYSTVEGRYLEERRKLPSIERTDPTTGQRWISREDGTEIVFVPSGAAGNPPGVATRCVLFADGSCVTSRIETIISELNGDEEDVLTWVRIEAPSFATVTVDRLRWETQLELGTDAASGLSQAAISCLPDQTFQIFPGGGGRIVVDRHARLLYWPKQAVFAQQNKQSGVVGMLDNQSMPEHIYVLNHNSPTVVQAVDSAGNSFTVSNDGRAAVVSRQQLEEQQLQENVDAKTLPRAAKLAEEAAGDELHAPRYFVVVPDSNGSPSGGWELKRYRGDIGSALISAERDPRCHSTRRHIEDEPRVTSITLLRPFIQLPVEKWNGTRCAVQDLAPPALHPVGWKVPRGSGKNAKDALFSSTRNDAQTGNNNAPRIEVRRMFQLTPFTDPLRDVVVEAMRNYVESIVEANMARRRIAPFDPRGADEIRNSEALLARFADLGSPRSNEEADANIMAELDLESSPLQSTARYPSIKQEQRRVERLQADEDRRFFRNGCQMSYFKSEFAHKFLKSQAPNIEDLFADNLEALKIYEDMSVKSVAQEQQHDQQQFITPDEPADQIRPRAATPTQRRKVAADVLVINPFSPTNAKPHEEASEPTGYAITKTPMLLPNVLLAHPGSGVDFGEITEGAMITRQFYLKNAGQRPVRFSVKEPLPEYGVLLRYEHGPIAPGMKRFINVTIQRSSHSAAVVNNSVEVKIRYDGGQLSVPIKFKEVKLTHSQQIRIRKARNDLLMSAGSDELMTEMFDPTKTPGNDNKTPPAAQALQTSPQPPQMAAEASVAEEMVPSPPQQPRPRSLPPHTTPASALVN